jgi:hypothetical protein
MSAAWDTAPTFLNEKELRRSTFIKTETSIVEPGYQAKPLFERCIQGGGDDYNTVIGPYIKACSKHLVKHWNPRGPFHYTCCDSETLADAIASGISRGLTFFIESDYSKFDSHQHGALLEIEQAVYFKLLAECPDFVRDGFLSQNKTTGLAMPRDGSVIRYKGLYRRRSGDFNTSCGNTIMNGFAQFSAIYLGTGKDKELTKQIMLDGGYLAHILGDDNLTQATEAVYEIWIKGYPAFEKIGLPITYATLGQNVWGAVYLQKRIWPSMDESGLLLAPKHGRVLQRAFTKYVGYALSKDQAAVHTHAVCDGLLKYYRNFPVVTPLLEKIKSLSYPKGKVGDKRRAELLRRVEKDMAHMGKAVGFLSDRGRALFRETYSLDADTERSVMKFVEGISDFAVELEHPWFTYSLRLDM